MALVQGPVRPVVQQGSSVDVQSRAAGFFPGLFQGYDFGVIAAVVGVETFADNRGHF